MNAAPIRSGRLAASAWGLVLAGAYYGSAKLGLDLAFSNESVTAVWPPTGIALAALVLWGRGLWPGVLLGAFLANVTTDVPVYTAAGIAIGNTLEAFVGAWLLDRFGFRPNLLRLRDLFALVVLGAVISTTISATIGVASLSLGDSLSEGTIKTWRLWWLGDMGGDLLVASTIFVLVTHWPYRDLPGKAFEAVALLVALVAIELVVFTNDVPATYLAFPIVVWAALRFLQPGAAVASLIFAVIAVSFTGNEQGPFFRRAEDDGLLLAQTFSAIVGLTGLILAILTYQRRRAERRAQVLAHELQAELLPPQLPEIPQFEAAGWYRAGMRGQEAGGDFYDLFEASPGRWLAVIGDVCGKGPEAASLTALARYTLRAGGRQANTPSEALRWLNEAIREQRSDQRFVTSVMVQLDVTAPDRGVLLSNGGHPPPVLVRADGEIEEVPSDGGMLLGIYPDPELVDQRLDLQPGDALVLFTDGLTERRDPGNDPSRQIGALLRASVGASADETAARLGELAMNNDGEPDDDVAVVVLRRVGSENGDGAAGAATSGRPIEVDLEPGPGCPAEARDALASLEGTLATQVYMDLRLLVSELVTNCVRHARLSPGDPIRLRVERSERMLRVEVTDPGPGFEPESEPLPRGEAGGWGLFLTEQLADRWGVDRAGGLTTVWLEMDLVLPGPSSPAAA
ncbi:MAG TPA: SpoIIE family protein phosphatase [Solirubrobacterales bacterium]|nr:SpoIIE family protein phosphatase [Solirubrobacterales bacterium]